MLRMIASPATASRVLVLLAVSFLLASGCRQTRLVRSENPTSRNAFRPASPGSLSSYIRTVLKISAEKGPQAEQKLQQAREQNPDLIRQVEESSAQPADPEAGLRLADSYLKAGLYFPAYQVYQRLRAAGGPRVEIELGLAVIWDKWQDYSLARTHAEYALELDAGSHAAWDLLGRIHLHHGDFQAAAVSFDRALGLQASDAVLFANAGYASLRLNRLDQAEAHLEKALSLDGTIPEAHNHLGIVLARKGDYVSALTHFGQNNEPAIALNNLGAACLEQGKWEDARRFLRQALSLKPDYEKALAHLRTVDTLAPPPASVKIPEGRRLQADEQPATAPGRVNENLAPPSRVSVSVASAVSEGAPSTSVSLRADHLKTSTEEEAETGKIRLDEIASIIEDEALKLAPARSALAENPLYQPALSTRLRSAAKYLTQAPSPQAPLRHQWPVAPALSRPGASLSVTATRWQEPLLHLKAPARTSLDWSTSPHSDQPSLFYVPSLADILLTWFFALGCTWVCSWPAERG